jgi:hypothetical protein
MRNEKIKEGADGREKGEFTQLSQEDSKTCVPEEGGEEDEDQFISETQGKGNDDPVDQSLYGKGGA